MKNKNFSVRLNGLSILLLMLLVCLTVFATLALVSANSEYKLSQRAREHAESAAACDADAQSAVLELTSLLKDIPATADFPSQMLEAARHIGYDDSAATSDGITVRFTTGEHGGLVNEVLLAITRDKITVERCELRNLALQYDADDTEKLYG